MDRAFGIPVKQVPSFPHIFASECGRVFAISRHGKLFEYSYMKDKDGYLRIGTSVNKKPKRLSVHRLVAEAYLGQSKLSVNHIDYNRSNNMVANLEYVTPKQNTHHSMKNGRICQGNAVMDDCSLLTICTLLPHKPLKDFSRSFKSTGSNILGISCGLRWAFFIKEYTFGQKTFSQKHREYRLFRNSQIAKMLKSGMKTGDIAKDFGITRARVNQLRKEVLS